MKLPIVLMGACLCASAADPIPVDKQEAISRKMLLVQQAQLELQGAQISYAEAKRKLDTSQADYTTAVDLERKARHAEGCDLSFEKEWHCPAPPPEVPKGATVAPSSNLPAPVSKAKPLPRGGRTPVASSPK